MRTVTVKIGYPGKIISCNHYKFKGRYTRPEARAFMIELGWLLKPHHVEDWNLPLTIRIDGQFKDLRSTPDLHNLLKITADAIQELTGINDREYLTETGTPQIGEPKLFITIKEA